MLRSLSARATISLGLRCDGACIFCAQDGLAHPPAASALAQVRASSDEVTFVGGEPLLAEVLPASVAAARALGFTRVGVQTNGVLLSTSLPQLADAGLTDVHLSIHGASAAVHDYHTGRPGSFAAALATLAAARERGLDCVVATVVTRSNFRVVGELPPLLSARGASAWCASFPVARGRAEPAFDRIMPRLALAMPFVLHALQTAKTLELPAFVAGAPLCLLGPYSPLSLSIEERAYAETCQSCAARPECPGIDEAYLARFGGDELDANRAQRSSLLPVSSFARMFVGIGERAASHVEPRRVSLPVLGKVQPGRGEVARGVPRKSGEALRDLFPSLFVAQAKPTHEWPVDVVLVGSGRRARLLAQAARGAPGLVIAAVASPHAPDRTALDVEGALVVRSLEEALAARSVKAVIVASATASHAAVVRVALARGLPVLVEKPVGATPEETASLAAEAEALGLVAMPAWQLALLPGLDALRATARSDVRVTLAFTGPREPDRREPLLHALSIVDAVTQGRLPSDARVEVDGLRTTLVAPDLRVEVTLELGAATDRIAITADDLTLERTAAGIRLGRGDDTQLLPPAGGDNERLLAHFRDVVRGDATPRFALGDAARLESIVARLSR